MQDLRLAIRSLAATPVVAAVAISSLALGIGANTAIFSLVDSLVLRTLPVAAPEQLVTVSTPRLVGMESTAGWSFAVWTNFAANRNCLPISQRGAGSGSTSPSAEKPNSSGACT